MRPDKIYQEEAAYDNCKLTTKLTTRERLELQKARLQNTIKEFQDQLEKVEDGLKLLNKNKQLEAFINLTQL